MQHSQIQEQIPLYALGGLPKDEAAQLAEHLAVCPGCRALLSEYEFVADELLLQVPAETAPASIGANLLRIAQADAGKSNGASQRAPSTPRRLFPENHNG